MTFQNQNEGVAELRKRPVVRQQKPTGKTCPACYRQLKPEELEAGYCIPCVDSGRAQHHKEHKFSKQTTPAPPKNKPPHRGAVKRNTKENYERAPEGCMTRRQTQIITLLVAGLTQKEVAVELDLTVFTVHEHLRRARVRLNTQTTCQAVAVALRKGLIQ